MDNSILKDVLLDIRAGKEPSKIEKEYQLSNKEVNDTILFYFNGLSGDKLIGMNDVKTRNVLSDKDKEIINKLHQLGVNKYEISDITFKSISIIEDFLNKKKLEQITSSTKEIKTENEDYCEKVILKNNTIEVNTYPDNILSSKRISIFKDIDDYHDTLSSGNKFVEERIRIFVDNNFNKNKYNSDTYNELFKFFTDYYHTSPILIAAITKVLYEKKVNFAMVYFNKETRMHHYQWIWNFNDNEISIFDILLKDNKDIKNEVYIHGANMEEFLNTQDLYSVRIQKDPQNIIHHFFTDYHNCFKFYGDQIMLSRMDSNNFIKLFINQYSNNGLFIRKKDTLATSTN